jgi:preprotein translocase subunit SecD
MLKAFSLLALVLLSCFSCAFNEKQPSHLEIKKVLKDGNISINTDYLLGKNDYPNYKHRGLTDSFLIKKIPDLIFVSADIITIQVCKDPFQSEDQLEFIVTINFNSSGADKLMKYTSDNLNSMMAIGIDNKILLVGSIKDVIKNELKFTLTYESLSSLKKELSKISNQVSEEGCLTLPKK